MTITYINPMTMTNRNGRAKSVEEPETRDIYSKAVKAGKRTYFFDVKATRRKDYFLSISESKKLVNKDGGFHYEKQKIHVYKEDFDKFIEGLNDTLGFIKAIKGDESCDKATGNGNVPDDEYTRVEFEDLKK